jgi:UV excision repair protein RAD23
MKIFIKTLKGEKTEYEVQPEDTVSALKQKVKDAQGHDPELQKLIAFGKIMEDAKPLADYNIKESDQIVLMVSKPKPPPRQPEPSPQSGAAQPPSDAQRPPPAQAAPQLTGPEFEQTVQRIMELGMPRDQVEAALRAARGNPDLAIEVLMGGVPASMLSGARRALHAGGPSAENPPNPAASGDSPFAFLRTNPAMLQIRTEIQRNPALLQSFIQQPAATNPGLAQLIAALPRPGQPPNLVLPSPLSLAFNCPPKTTLPFRT